MNSGSWEVFLVLAVNRKRNSPGNDCEDATKGDEHCTAEYFTQAGKAPSGRPRPPVIPRWRLQAGLARREETRLSKGLGQPGSRLDTFDEDHVGVGGGLAKSFGRGVFGRIPPGAGLFD